ncbi:glutamate-rich protein 3, partial [Carlito syrichta]|uniref:Glutamate-rich protein 3 n=1 Tax=Carlito syrichta TaxID=1868482 RepID=A0A3Q0DP93_CARSF
MALTGHGRHPGEVHAQDEEVTNRNWVEADSMDQNQHEELQDIGRAAWGRPAPCQDGDLQDELVISRLQAEMEGLKGQRASLEAAPMDAGQRGEMAVEDVNPAELEATLLQARQVMVWLLWAAFLSVQMCKPRQRRVWRSTPCLESRGSGPAFPGLLTSPPPPVALSVLMAKLSCQRSLAAYNSLTDKHLAGYFNNTRIRRHLLRTGLITRSGRILSEKEYQLNIMKRDHQKYIRECLAQAIFHKVLDMERYHQLEIKKKLETLARKERIQRFKGVHTQRSVESNMPVLSPHPPAGPKTNRDHSVLVDERHASPSAMTTPRPYTAPGNMQPPIRLQPLLSHPAVGTVPKITSGSRSKVSLLEKEAPFPVAGKKAAARFRTSPGSSQRRNPFQLPRLSSFMMPIPPPPLSPSGKVARESRPETWRRRRFRPTTASDGVDPLFTTDSRRIRKTSLHSNAAITMVYLGKSVHLSCDNPDCRDEIKVYQQHCGGENLCVYKGKLLEKETFQFISKRHHGFPFSLTFFLNGMQVNRLSSCCEYKHRKGSRLGGKRGYFGFVCVERASPCYKCIIAMGLDRKASSPNPRKEKSTEEREEPKKGEEKVRQGREQGIPGRNEVEVEGSPASASAVFSAQEMKTEFREVRTVMEEMERKGKPGRDVWEDDQENTLDYGYEEDFEADAEKQDEKADEERPAEQRVDGASKSPSEDGRDHALGPGGGREPSPRAPPDADGDAREERDADLWKLGYLSKTIFKTLRPVAESQRGWRDEEPRITGKTDLKTASSSSSRSHPCSSGSEDGSAVGPGEAHTEDDTGESARSASSEELSEDELPEKPHLPPEEPLDMKTGDQEIAKTEGETEPLPGEDSFEKVLEEEMERRSPGITESLSEKARKHASEADEEKDPRSPWEGSPAEVKGKWAGLPGVERGGKNSLPSACDLALDAPHKNLAVGERAALDPSSATKPLAQGVCKLAKEEAPREDPAGPAAAGDSAARNQDEAPRELALVLTVAGAEKAAHEGAQGSEKAAALVSGGLRETPGEAARLETGAAEGGEAESDVESEEDTSTDLEDTGPLEDAASATEEGSEEAALGGEEPAPGQKGAMGTEAPLRPCTGEAGAGWRGGSEASPGGPGAGEAERAEAATPAEAAGEEEAQ